MRIKKFFDIKRKIVIIIGLLFVIGYNGNSCFTYAKYLGVLATPSKAYDEMKISVTKGINTTAPGYYNFLKNTWASDGTKAIESSIKANIGNQLTQIEFNEFITAIKNADNAANSNKLMETVNELSIYSTGPNPKFTDFKEFSKSLIADAKNKYATFLNEVENGLYWVKPTSQGGRGQNVWISRKVNPSAISPNECDNVILDGTLKGIVECKYVTSLGNPENQVFANLEEIVKKWRISSKLDESVKSQYPLKYGQINIQTGAFTNLNEPLDFVNAVRNKNIIGPLGNGVNLFTIDELKSFAEIHIIVGAKRIIVKSEHWY